MYSTWRTRKSPMVKVRQIARPVTPGCTGWSNTGPVRHRKWLWRYFHFGVPEWVLFAELFARLACGVDRATVNGHQAERRLQSNTGRRQIIHDSAQSGVGFGLHAAVPGGSDKVVNLVIARAAQCPYQGFCLV